MMDRRPGRSVIWVLLCSGLTLAILWLALMPADAAPSGTGWDKLNHAGAIAMVTGVAYLALRPRCRAATAAFLYGIFLGVLIEILQGTLTAGRSAEWSDVAADLVGAACAWGVIRIYQRRSSPER